MISCVSYVVCVSLWALFKVLVYATADFKAAFQCFPALFVEIPFLLKSNRDLKWKNGCYLLLSHQIRPILTLRHSMAVPAWC